MKRLFIIPLLLCFAFPAIADTTRDQLILKLGALSEQERQLKEDLEVVEYRKVKIFQALKKLNEKSETKPDEENNNTPDINSNRNGWTE